MKIKILFTLIILFIFNACSMRPTIEDKTNYMNNVIKELEKENYFEDNSRGYDSKILYNRNVLSLKKIEFLNLFNTFIEKKYKVNYDNLIIDVKTTGEKYNTIKTTTLNYNFAETNIICLFSEGYLYGYGSQVSFNCMKK